MCHPAAAPDPDESPLGTDGDDLEVTLTAARELGDHQRSVRDQQGDVAVLTVPELARLLRIGRQAAYELARQPGFPAVRVGRSVRIPRHALCRWLADATR